MAMGLPFSLAVTLILCAFVGYTVNNITLAAVIIVLGIVVDDAIIVADSISKQFLLTKDRVQAATDGTLKVLQPVIAGILTTCVAFLPLLFFEGRFGMFVKYIPLVVLLMLFASLIESFLILPSHLKHEGKQETSSLEVKKTVNKLRDSFMKRLEDIYAKSLNFALNFRKLFCLLFTLFLVFSIYIFKSELKFVMFPREEPKEFAVKAISPIGTTRIEMAENTIELEKIIEEALGDNLVGYRTVIGESRRGGQVRDNEANLRVEILPPSEQEIPFEEVLSKLQDSVKELSQFEEVRFIESWWSSDSGSPITIQVLENNDERRKLVSEKLKDALEKLQSLKNVEIERPIVKTEFALELNKEETIRLNLDPEQLAQTMRAYIEGQILYRLYEEEEIDVRLTSGDETKDVIDKILELGVTNNEGYLVPLNQVVKLKKQEKPANIQRINFKKSNQVFADLTQDAKKTPLEIADYLEESVFPKLSKLSPTTIFNFRGEIEDSKESQSDFITSVAMTLALIFVILAFMFSSLFTPILVSLVIPFGASGVALAFWLHGFEQYGFFAVIGAIGMLGVVINDSIVMINHFENELEANELKSHEDIVSGLTPLSVSRLRPVLLTTLTTVAGVFPTAYGLGGYDAMLADMMLAMGWGLLFGTLITLFFLPIAYSFLLSFKLYKGGTL